MDRTILCRDSDRSRKKVQFRGIFRGKFAGKSIDFAGIFGANLAENQSVKKKTILWLFSGKLCSIGFGLTRPAFLLCFSNRGHHLLFQQQYAPELNQWQSL